MYLVGNTYLFKQFGLDVAFEQMAWAGFAVAELHMLSLDEGMRTQVQTIDRLKHVAEHVQSISDRHSLPICAIETSPRHEISLNSLALAHEMGVPIVTTGWGPRTTMEEAVSTVLPYAERAGELGVTLAIKPHQNFAVYGAATVLQLAQEVDAEALRINYDPSHIYRANEDVAAMVAPLSEYIVHSQFRDTESREVRGPAEAQVAGRGAIDIPGVLRAFAEVGYAGPLSFLCVGAEDYTLPQCVSLAAEHKGYMSRCLQELGVG